MGLKYLASRADDGVKLPYAIALVGQLIIAVHCSRCPVECTPVGHASMRVSLCAKLFPEGDLAKPTSIICARQGMWIAQLPSRLQ